MLHNQIIGELNNFLKNYLNLSYPPLKSRDNITFTIVGTYAAVNFKRTDAIQIKTIPWFDNFYLYLEVKFSNDYTQKLISLSIFQGEETDLRKNQLFRAEWDDYNIEGEQHPQPHWHITRDKAYYESFNELINISDENQTATFKMFQTLNTEIFNTKRIHFAMSANWHNKDIMVHKIDDATKIVHWIEGLLEHIKYELSN